MLLFIVAMGILSCMNPLNLTPWREARRHVAQVLISTCVSTTFGAYFPITNAFAATPPFYTLLDDKQFAKTLFNMPPVPAEYPDNLAGEWRTTYVFKGAEFSPFVPLDTLAKGTAYTYDFVFVIPVFRAEFDPSLPDPNVPGFRKLSVAALGDIGKDGVSVHQRFSSTVGARGGAAGPVRGRGGPYGHGQV